MWKFQFFTEVKQKKKKNETIIGSKFSHFSLIIKKTMTSSTDAPIGSKMLPEELLHLQIGTRCLVEKLFANDKNKTLRSELLNTEKGPGNEKE